MTGDGVHWHTYAAVKVAIGAGCLFGFGIGIFVFSYWPPPPHPFLWTAGCMIAGACFLRLAGMMLPTVEQVAIQYDELQEVYDDLR